MREPHQAAEEMFGIIAEDWRGMDGGHVPGSP